ncbi:MAG: hypothetical protein HKN82_11505 [Akkermansiaceae bacterium]|nr:hypothetical protein [Akkermansiaceae bacterium]
MVAVAPAGAAETPPTGSKERAAIIHAVRDPLMHGFGQALAFRVRHLRRDGDWAYLEAEPRTEDDDALTWKGTVWEDDADRMDDPSVLALLHFKRGRWYVVKQILAPTDYPLEMFFRYKAPRTIFPAPPSP